MMHVDGRWTAEKGSKLMAVEAVRSAVGEDGIQIAVEALKEIASGSIPSIGEVPRSEDRLAAAQTLLQYGLASYDGFGNAQLG